MKSLTIATCVSSVQDTTNTKHGLMLHPINVRSFAQVTDCGNKLRRAEQLISGLGGEKTSWARFSGELQNRYENVTGTTCQVLAAP